MTPLNPKILIASIETRESGTKTGIRQAVIKSINTVKHHITRCVKRSFRINGIRIVFKKHVMALFAIDSAYIIF